MTIGERIAECRKTKKLSQEYVAEKLEVTRQAVSKWETDVNVPDTQNFIKLARLLGTTVEYLACGEEAISFVKIEKEAEKEMDGSVVETKKRPLIIRIIGFILLFLGFVPIIIMMRYAPTIFEVLPFGILCFAGWKMMFKR
jgi:transcriptional regulator with XRE-family HTH domain